MKKSILVLFTVAIAAVNMNAQDQKPHKTPEQKAEQRANKLNDLLALNADQKEKVKGVILEHEKEHEAIRSKHEKNREAFRAENKKNKDATDADLKKILTPEQYEKLQKHKAEVEQKHKEKRAGKHKPMPAPEDK